MSDTAPGVIDGQSAIELPALDPVTAPPVAADEKPKRRRRTSTSTSASDTTRPKAPRGGARQPKLETRLVTNLTSLGIMVGMVNQADGLAIVQGAPAFCEALAALADESPKVRAGLESALSGGAVLKVCAAGSAIVLPIMANHGLIPAALAGAFGAPPGEGAPGAQ